MGFPSNDHELQVDLFEYRYKQTIRFQVSHTQTDDKVYDVGRAQARKLAEVEPYGIIAINTFTKKLHIVPVTRKIGRADWKPALQQIIKKAWET